MTLRLNTLGRSTRGTFPTVPWGQVIQWIHDGVQYAGIAGSHPDRLGGSFESYVGGVYRRYGIVGAAVAARAFPLSQLHFKWRRFADMSLFGSGDLLALERPHPDQTRPALLMQAEAHVSLSGAAVFHRTPQGIRLLRPDWVEALRLSDREPDDPDLMFDSVIAGYRYYPGGERESRDPILLNVDDVAVWIPEPSPEEPWKGESWVSSVIREITLDGQATSHMEEYFKNAATPNVVFTLDAGLTKEQFGEAADMLRRRHEGPGNAYKSIVASGLTDVNVIGSNLGDLDMKNLQGGLETRVSARSRVPAQVIGLREGMQGQSLSVGNYSATRRLWADTWFAPYAESLCAALEKLVAKPGRDVELYYDPDQVLLLQEDRSDAAEIMMQLASAARQLSDGGWEPDAVVNAVGNGKLELLAGNHTGLLPVQVQNPSEGMTQDE